MRVAPVLVVRMAAWPFSTVEPLASPHLAGLAREVEAADEALRDQSSRLSERLAGIVPVVTDQALRRRILALRRAVHRSGDVIDESARVVAQLKDRAGNDRSGALGAAAAEVARDDAHRRAREALIAAFDAAYAQAEETERSSVLAVACSPRFDVALAVAHPSLRVQWHAARSRFARSRGDAPPARPQKARHRRLELTITNLVLRAAGRATPSGLWAGVFPLTIDPADGLEVDADRAPILTGPAPGGAMVQVDLASLDDAYRALAGTGLPSGTPSAQAALDTAIAGLDAPAASAWASAVAELRQLCESIAQAIDGDRADLASDLHGEVRTVVDELRAGAGVGAWAGKAVVRVDLRMPLRGQGCGALLGSLGDSVVAWERSHAALGFGALWASATAEEVLRDQPQPIRDLHRRAGVPTLVSLFAARFDAGFAARAGDLVTAFEAWLAEHALESQCDVRAICTRSERGWGLGPWGSAVMSVALDEGGTSGGIEVRSVRVEPAQFSARFAAIVPEAFGAARAAVWASRWPFHEVRPVRFVAPNAALAPRLRGDHPDAEAVLGPGPALRRVAGGRIAVVDASGEASVPVLVTAAAAIAETAPMQRLLDACSTWGWELVASGLPPLPAEVATWRHLPALVDRGVTVHPERWLLEPDDLRACAAAPTPEGRYLRWRVLADRVGLPEWITIRMAASPNAEHRTMPATGVLAVEAMLADLPRDLAVVVALRGPTRSSMVAGPSAAPHVAEVALTWTTAD